MARNTDVVHLITALKDNRVFVTENFKDFTDLHDLIIACGGKHAGILTIRHEDDPAQDLSAEDTVNAICKLEKSGIDMTNKIVILNYWR